METIFSTAGTSAPERSRYWTEVIAQTYFPLDLRFREPDAFNGRLSLWQLGPVSLSRLTCDALRYRRRSSHFAEEVSEQYLVTVPALSDVTFAQCDQRVECPPGGFILERSHEPYEFSHAEANDLWVLKVQGQDLSAHIRAPDRFCTLRFDATVGVGSLFVQMMHLIPSRFDQLSEDARSVVGQQLIDLLALTLKSDARALTSGLSTVREAHLSRIETYIRRNLGDPRLDPEQVAQACGISTRYLHELFRDTNQTLGQWIRDQRLAACREALANPGNRQSVAEIAYRWGFSDQARFSRTFKSRFGQTPKEFRDRNGAGRP